MRSLFMAIVLALVTGVSKAEDIIDLPSFPSRVESSINQCFQQAIKAKELGTKLCEAGGYGDYWICPQSLRMRLSALEYCKRKAVTSKDRVTMLYLLGLVHDDFHYQTDNKVCPEHFRYQEGSEVCVYTGVHYEQLMEEFPTSPYADMAAVKIAQATYRYYECEGSVLCSIENRIAGWVDYLERHPSSRFAGRAVDETIGALRIAGESPLDPDNEWPDGVIEDIRRLRATNPKVSAEKRAELAKALDETSAILRKIQEARSTQPQKQ